MIRQVLRHPLAETDLIGIWQYTFDRWGADQADKYLDELNRAIQQLTVNPETGAERNDVREGYRVLFVHSHAVYYTVRTAQIRVIRVLHGQMDTSRHL